MHLLDSDRVDRDRKVERDRGGRRSDSNPGCYSSAMRHVVACPPTERNWDPEMHISYSCGYTSSEAFDALLISFRTSTRRHCLGMVRIVVIPIFK